MIIALPLAAGLLWLAARREHAGAQAALVLAAAVLELLFTAVGMDMMRSGFPIESSTWSTKEVPQSISCEFGMPPAEYLIFHRPLTLAQPISEAVPIKHRFNACKHG